MAAGQPATALLFPGQGSQSVGMGKELAAAEPLAAETFRQADELLGLPLSRLCFEGPASDLDRTDITQPALLTHSVAVQRVLEHRFPHLRYIAAAGHSLGEFSALVAAGSLSFEEGLRLVRERGLAMKRAGELHPGGMAAVLGLEVAQVEQACQHAADQTGSVVQIANDNSPGQIVISGEEAALAVAVEQCRSMGAKKTVRLAVSIAAHSALMDHAQAHFTTALAGARIRAPRLAVFGNVSAAPLRSEADVRIDLSAQLTSRVRWTESVRAMIAAGATRFLELGPGSVLTGLLRRIDREASGAAVGDPHALAQLGA
jgi:[acyl-carrier-protein] S-malonyltransferase